MGIESGIKAEKNTKNIEDDDKKKLKKQKIKMAVEGKKKKEIREHIKADNALGRLKNAISSNNIKNISQDSENVIRKAFEGNIMNVTEVEHVLEKIEEMINDEEVSKYIPKDLVISKDEFIQAIADEEKRGSLITKLDNVLGILGDQANPNGNLGLNLFSGYVAILDKRLVRIQENHIDIKDTLLMKSGKKELGFFATLREIFKLS